MKVAAYCRVSTDKDDQLHSLANQIEYFTTYINNHNTWQLVDIFADEGITGTSTKNRTEFNRMISMAQNKELDFIITKEVSRFSRNTIDTLSYTRQLKEMGIGVLFINDNINTLDNEGEFRLTIMASVAQEESRKISERVKWGQRRSMEQGVVFGNNSIYGYHLVSGTLTIDKKQAEIVKEIYFKYVEERKGSKTIANELTRNGIKPVYANSWSAETIMKILKNEKYAGDVLHRKYVTTNHLNHTATLNTNKDDVIFIKDNHPAIIDKKTWNKAQSIIKSRNFKLENQRNRDEYWCSGKLFCGDCGAKFFSCATKGKEGYHHSWVCSNKKKHGKQKLNHNLECVGCNNSRIRDDILVLCLSAAIKLYCSHSSKTKKEIVNELEHLQFVNYKKQKNQLKKTIETLHDNKTKAYISFLNNELAKDEIDYINKEIDKKINIQHEELEKIEKLDSLQNMQKENFKERDAILQDIYNNTSNEMLEKLYDCIVEKIVIFKRNVQIHFYGLPFVFDIHFRVSRTNSKYNVYITEQQILENMNNSHNTLFS